MTQPHSGGTRGSQSSDGQRIDAPLRQPCHRDELSLLLNLILSCLAALQGAILLIAARRADQIASELARHDYETNLDTDRLVHAVHDLTLAIAERVGATRPPPAGGEADRS